ncbi:MAG: hypothetical protein ACKVOE_06275 [Rickettsiales bacterium]
MPPMWNPVQKLLHNEPVRAKTPPALPLRRSALALSEMKIGSIVRFAIDCPLPPFTGKRATVVAQREYRFGDDSIKSHVLNFGDGPNYTLTIAEDSQGNYLALSRALDIAAQDSWFGRDALSFFKEKSSAKTIRCKIDLMEEGAWAAARYSKSVDWVEGTLNNGTGRTRRVHYNLLVNESGEKALEIEHDDESDASRVYVTVYRPISDLAAIESGKVPIKTEAAPVTEPPLFKEPVMPAAQPKARPDFRRISEAEGEEIHIPRTANRPTLVTPEPAVEEFALPAFLTAETGNYLSLDEVIPPEPERVRVGLMAARTLIDRALSRNARVRDVLREMVGLDSALAEEVIFELPLSDNDYRILAMRYRLRPDHRDEIRTRLEEELKTQLGVK